MADERLWNFGGNGSLRVQFAEKGVFFFPPEGFWSNFVFIAILRPYVSLRYTLGIRAQFQWREHVLDTYESLSGSKHEKKVIILSSFLGILGWTWSRFWGVITYVFPTKTSHFFGLWSQKTIHKYPVRIPFIETGLQYPNCISKKHRVSELW